MSKFYITTPLYYVNDEPHIGHAYTTILADVLARYHRSFGDEVYFLTGTDEHGQKVQQASEKRNVDSKSHVDEFVIRFKDIWKKLHISNDDFIRTTEKRHTDRVKEVLNILWEKGEIYLAEYEGLYSVSEERFITEKEAEEGDFREIKKIKEKNYFFKMSKYQSKLIDHIQNNPDFILPKKRANEVLGFLKQPLNDLCISRPKSRLEWGIEIPFDTKYVTYVWFDALLNYITAIGYGVNDEKFNNWWPANYHLIGKDILTTHSVYWITMLMAMEVDLPKSIFAHGWWLMEDEKMSKSLGNVVRPLDLADKYGVDSLRYFLMRDMVLGQDASYSFSSFMSRYNSDLANDFGNLVNRVTILIRKNFNSKIPVPGILENAEKNILNLTNETSIKVKSAILELKIHDAIEQIMNVFRNLNKYLELRAPWKQIKESIDDGSPSATCLYTSVNVLFKTALLLHPIMPSKIDSVLSMLGQKCPENIFAVELLEANTPLGDGKSPFPRIEELCN
jgi:methionyl-tRNA synthetase